MASFDYDVAVLGSGPVASSLALALARHAPQPERIVLIGQQAPKPADNKVIDPRAIALNHGSQSFLQGLGVWPAKSASINSVHVSQAGHFGRTVIDHKDLHVTSLGYVVSYDTLLERLQDSVLSSGIGLLKQRAPRPLSARNVHIKLAEDSITARLAVICDGTRPVGYTRDYQQQAVLATIKASQAKPGQAFERFTQNGPLALLPHPAGAQLYSLVWCVKPARAQELLQMPASNFNAALMASFGRYLGELQIQGDTYSFGLALHVGAQQLANNVLALGNAAQTLHPVAGQGLNLGLRDVAVLAHLLHPWLSNPDIPLQSLLATYVVRRRLDRGLTVAITDTLARVFTSKSGLLRHLCGLGLFSLDALPALRKPLATQLLQGLR